MARRATITPEIITLIEAEVVKAHWPKVVARRLGVHTQTFNSWMKKGEEAHLNDDGDDPRDDLYLYRQLYERIEEAEAKAEMDLLNHCREQAALGKTSWNGFLTTLERRFSDRWRRRDPLMGDTQESWETQVRKFMLQSRQ